MRTNREKQFPSNGTGPSQGRWKHEYAQKVLEIYQNWHGQKRDLIAEKPFLGGTMENSRVRGSAVPDVFNPKTGDLFDYKFVKYPGSGLGPRQRGENANNVPGLTNQHEINP